ncbi:rhodanese-like domain-containing protein [Aliiroseovarius sp.]|uniref:rhodanese-like domain-containing protein n=1 Tax=Aliiroseovarius sp. TaxID=1872442 RepID=UPI002636752A|nr:rhodanese-like domain-containing protein [Aliiroseovarius sp.]
MYRRGFLILGGAAGVAGFGAVLLKTAQGFAEVGFSHVPLSVDEMRARGALIVDIRTPSEWALTGVIEGAELVTFQGASSFAGSFMAALGDKIADGRDVVLICRSGNRSQTAAGALAGRIPNKVISVAGGMKRLMLEGYRPVAVS